MGLWNWIKENKGKIIGTTIGVLLAPATGGISLAICGGIGFAAGMALDADVKKRENENKQLNLKGEVSKQIREEVKNLQDERSNEASQLNNLDQQIAQKQNKLNDPNTPEQEKIQIRSEIASLVSQRSSIQSKIAGLDNKIEKLIKQNNQTITGSTLSNLELDPQTKLIIGAIIFLVIYFTLIKEKER